MRPKPAPSLPETHTHTHTHTGTHTHTHTHTQTHRHTHRLACCCCLCGMAGAYLSTAQAAGFGREMTAGRGYIALAALIFANWRPIHAMGACFLFGLLEAISNLYPNIDVFGMVTIPVQFTQALPYILTVIILAGFVGKAIPPKAIGAPYVKER